MKKRATASKKAKAKARAKKGPGRTRSGPVSRRMRDVEKAIETLGRGRVRPGPVALGGTGWITPTGRGFGALDDFILGLQRSRKKGADALMRLDLSVKWRGPDGRYSAESRRDFLNIVVPSMRDVRRFRKKGESEAHAFRGMLVAQIRAAIFRQIENVKDLRGGTDALMRELIGKSAQEIRGAFRQFKAQRGLLFKARFARVVT